MIDESWYTRLPGVRERVGAGGIVVRKDDDTIRIALIKDDNFREYGLPKGGVKKDENLEEAARREIQEETGITDLRTIKFLGVLPRMSYGKKRWAVNNYFLFVSTQKRSTPTDTSKKHVIVWFPIDELPVMLWPEQQKLIEDTKESIKELFAA